jgi:hypothetical protein
MIDENAQCILVDGPCDNYKEIISKFKNNFVVITLKTDLLVDKFAEDFDYIVISEKNNDENHTVKIKDIVEL